MSRLVVILGALALISSAHAQLAVGVAGRDSIQKSTAAIPLHGKVAIDGIVRISIVEGQFAGELIAQLPDQVAAYRLEVPGAGDWVVRKRTLAGTGAYITITRYDFDAPLEEYWSTTLSLRANYFYVYSQTGDAASGLRVRLTQSAGTLRFNVSTADKGVQKVILNATAASLKELQVNHPREIREYLVPAIRRLTGRNILKPGAADVYRAFDAITPDPAIARKLDDLLLKLEADSFKDRQDASKQLAALGAPGVLAALRIDLDDLSGEVRNRLEVFLAEHSTGAFDKPEDARRDAPFLLDCLEDEDLTVRKAAKAALETALGKAVEFDPAGAAAARGAAIDALRRKLEKDRPATQPVKLQPVR